MALSTDPWDATELVAYINEVWPGVTDEEFFAPAVAANFFRDFSRFATAGGDIFHIPDAFTNAFTVQTQSTQATEVTTDAPATTDNTLTINNHVYIATLLGDKDAQQVAAQYSLSEIYNRKATGTLVEDLEADIFGLHSSVTTNTQGDTASVISDVEIRLALETLESADVPRDEIAFFFHPYSYYSQILAIQKYYDASQAGWQRGMESVIPGGNLGRATRGQNNAVKGTLFGVPVFTTSKVVNTLLAVKNLLAHRDSFTFATQTPGGSRIRRFASYWHENLGTLVTWDMINGVTANREATAVVINGSNAFVGS